MILTFSLSHSVNIVKALKLLTKGCNRSNRQYTLYGKTAVYIIPGFNGCYARFPLDGLGILAIRDQFDMSRGTGQMRIEMNVFHIYGDRTKLECKTH